MNDLNNNLLGVFSPVITPFNKDLSVNHKKLIQQCKWLLSQNVGLAVFGTNSEAINDNLIIISSCFSNNIVK